MASEPMLGDGLVDKEPPSVMQLAWHFFVLGITAFGGPPVHLGMYQERFVERYKWLSPARFAELMAMAGCLPGPTSTQVAFAIGITQQGALGGLISGLMFMLPGAIAMCGLGFVANSLTEQIKDPSSPASAVAIACSAVGVALVFIAVTGLLKKVVKGPKLGAICFFVAAVVVGWAPPPPWLNPALILAGGLVTAISPVEAEAAQTNSSESRGKVGLPVAAGVAILALYIVVGAWTIYDNTVDNFWLIPFLTAGMFVWGGGPVVLPMLMTALVEKHEWVQKTIFLSGIAIAEMMPGPVFNMSAFLGVQLALQSGYPWMAGTLLAWMALAGPGVVLIFGAMPLWDKLRNFEAYSRALPGLNAAAVGLLVSTIFVVYAALESRSPWPQGSRAVALTAYAAFEFGHINVPIVVFIAGGAGYIWSTGALSQL